jgi:hypothetical protein
MDPAADTPGVVVEVRVSLSVSALPRPATSALSSPRAASTAGSTVGSTAGSTADARATVAPLSTAERQQLQAALRTAPVIPSPLMREPAVAALAEQARRVLARGTGRRPEDVELDARVLPGSGDRVVVFRDGRGRSAALTADAPLGPREAHGVTQALADLNVIAGVGLGFRVVPGVFSVGAMPTAARFADRDGIARHLRAGASTTLGGGAWVWELKDRPVSVGPAVAVSAPFVSSERDPLLGDKVEVSIPGYVTVMAAVKQGAGDKDDVGWLGVVWHQGLLGHGPGPTLNAKLVVGHPALAAPLRPVVAGAAAVLSPIMARIESMTHRHAPAADDAIAHAAADVAPAR